MRENIKNFMVRFSPWLAAIAVTALMCWVLVFSRRMPPELTPEDRIEIEQFNREYNEIRKQLYELKKLRKLYYEGKLWRA